MRRLLTLRGWVAATLLALLIIACAVGAAFPAARPPGGLDHPWSHAS